MTEQSKFFEGLLQQETFFLESQDGFGLKYNIPNFFICFGLPSVILSQWMMISYLALLLIIPCHSLTVCHLMRRRLPRKLVEIHIKFKREFPNCPKQQKTRPIDKYHHYHHQLWGPPLRKPRASPTSHQNALLKKEQLLLAQYRMTKNYNLFNWMSYISILQP